MGEKSDSDYSIEELDNVNEDKQAEVIADFPPKIRNEYEAIEDDLIPKQWYKTDQHCPFIEEYQVYKRIMKMSTRKSTVKDDIPMKIIKVFAVELSEPLSFIFDVSLRNGCFLAEFIVKDMKPTKDPAQYKMKNQLPSNTI